MDLDKKQVIERSNRYNKINLTAVWSDTGQDGKLSFTLPPLASSGFAHPSKNDALIKIRRVYIDANDDRADSLYWYKTNATIGEPIPFLNGFILMTSIMSRNNYFLTGEGTDVSGMKNDNSDFSSSKLGVMVKSDTQFNSDARGYRSNGGIMYEDFSDIMNTGTLSSNPFGSKIDVWIQREENTDVLVPYITQTATPPAQPTRFDNVSLRVELEVYIL